MRSRQTESLKKKFGRKILLIALIFLIIINTDINYIKKVKAESDSNNNFIAMYVHPRVLETYKKQEKLRECLMAAVVGRDDEQDIDLYFKNLGDEQNYYTEGKLNNLPEGYEQCVALVTYVETLKVNKLYLFAIDNDYKKAKLLDRIEIKDYYNAGKAYLKFINNEIIIISKKPFHAYEVEITFIWDGNKVMRTSLINADPTQEILDQQRALLDKKDMEGLMKFDKISQMLYPMSYHDYFQLPKQILIFANDEAIKEYNKHNFERAKDIMEYAFTNYNAAHIPGNIELEKFSSADFEQENQYCLDLDVYMGMLNNYALYLHKCGEYQRALERLSNVKQLCPERIVVYINLGDLYWDLLDQENAIKHYAKYSEMMGSHRLPDYVKQRLNHSGSKVVKN